VTSRDLVIRVRNVAGDEAHLPECKTEGAAGADLSASIPEPWTIEPGQRVLVPTGIALAIPQGFEGQIRPRSGLALRHGVTVLNAPGTIDSDYRGELKVLLINLGERPFVIEPGDRIAQLVIAACACPRFEVVWELDETQRGAGGYGSTGL
jgi:dUTP pyrophosphatase